MCSVLTGRADALVFLVQLAEPVNAPELREHDQRRAEDRGPYHQLDEPQASRTNPAAPTAISQRSTARCVGAPLSGP
jgi:hypothetical protein